jgi:hypothetical protein
MICLEKGGTLRQKNISKCEGKDIQECCKTCDAIIWSGVLADEEESREEVGCGGDEDVEVDVWVYQEG